MFKVFKIIYYLEYKLNNKKLSKKKIFFFSKIYKYIENTLNTLNIEQDFAMKPLKIKAFSLFKVEKGKNQP